MIHLENDYNIGAHPKIIEKMNTINYERFLGYGNDSFCSSAKEKIKNACENPNADVYFLVGGTQTNLIAISSLLDKYEGVISAKTGHINVHEAGAIEATGHKILEVPTYEGKIIISELEEYLNTFYQDENRSHSVYPGMVYISHPTEYGTLYSKNELEQLREICTTYNMSLYLDGARLGYALASDTTDVTLKDIASLCDAFCIGGTKVGTLFGEALVFTKNNTPKNFITIIKQQGALLAKGWLLGLQFDTLFTDNLYFENGKNAIRTANHLKTILKEKGYQFFLETPTNQQFIILDNETRKKLSEYVGFTFWEKYDENHTVVRFVTNWATNIEDIEKLKELL